MTTEKVSWILSVELWVSILAQHRLETKDFKIELHTLTDAGILSLKPVTRNFLDFAPRMFLVVRPQHFYELRLAISYLEDLYERQSAALERECERFEMRSLKDARVFKTLQSAPMTNAEKIEFVKTAYGWE